MGRRRNPYAKDDQKRTAQCFVPRFREALDKAHIDQKTAARRAGCTDAAMSRWVNGSRLPSLDLFRTVALVTGASADWLLGIDFRTQGIEALEAAKRKEDVLVVMEAAVAKLRELEQADKCFNCLKERQTRIPKEAGGED